MILILSRWCILCLTDLPWFRSTCHLKKLIKSWKLEDVWTFYTIFAINDLLLHLLKWCYPNWRKTNVSVSLLSLCTQLYSERSQTIHFFENKSVKLWFYFKCGNVMSGISSFVGFNYFTIQHLKKIRSEFGAWNYYFENRGLSFCYFFQ